MTATLLNGDCLELMKSLPDRSIDLFLCDLPYGCLVPHKKGEGIPRTEGALGGCEWDIPIDLEQFWIQVERLMKDDHTPIIHFCNTRFGFELMKSKEAWFRYDLVWNKIRGVGFLNANKMPMRSHENIYIFSKKGARYTRVDVEVEGAKEYVDKRDELVKGIYGIKQTHPHKSEEGIRCVKSVVEVNAKTLKGQHPTQKPDELYRWLIARYSKPGDTILDPTAGSFASVFTATAMGRNAIGMEMKTEFYEKALARSVPEIIIPVYNNADLPHMLYG